MSLDASGEQAVEAGAVEYVVAQYQADAIACDELAAYDEGFGQTVGGGLLGIGEPHAELLSRAQQPLERRHVLRSGDDEYVAYAGQHKNRDRVVDHRLVEYRQQLLAHALGNRV